jgi:uncharacterized membrane protein
MRWLPPLFLLAAAVVLGISWDQLPETWAVHWGGSDQPDNWFTKTPAQVFFFQGLGLVIWIASELTVGWMNRSSAPRDLIDIQASFTRIAILGVSILLAALSLVLPLGQPRSSIPIVAAAFAGLSITLAIGILDARRRARKATLPEGYEGLIYRNPRDSRIWVPKLAGIGWTLNFAHRRAWVYLALLIAVPIGTALVALIAIRPRG